jgi:BA14K-like protein
MKKLAVLALAIATGLSGVGPSFAENLGDEHSAQSRGGFGDSGVQNSRSYGGFDRCNIYRCGGYRHGHYGGRYYGDNYYRHHNGGYYNNGYYNHGYYRHHDNGAGALIGGLAAGAIIGGLIASQPQAGPVGNGHVDWCYSRYRSYRAYDNTYQPYYGPRRQCYSPYD